MKVSFAIPECDAQITQITQIPRIKNKMKDERTYKIIGATMKVQSTDYADCAEMRDERTYKIIGAAIEVHRELGCGFLDPQITQISQII